MSKKKVELTEFEKAFIKEQFEKKLEWLLEELNVMHPESELPKYKYKTYFAPKYNTINKLNSNSDFFTPNEINIIIGVVKPNKSPECENSRIISFDKPLDWLNISEEHKRKMENCDFLNKILIKTGYFDGSTEKKKPPYFYGDILRLINDMSESSKICLSINEPLDIYKIGFLNQRNELLTLELKSSIDLRNLSFSNYKGKVKDVMSGFMRCISKNEAYNLFLSLDKSKYPANNVEFLTELLK